MRPENLTLRCYGYQTLENKWVVKCIDLALVVEEDTIEEAKKSLEDSVVGYINTVIETNDKESIPRLLKRKSPLSDRLHYHFIASIVKLHKFKDRFTFEESLPFHLANHC